ncbi:f-box domain protein [Fusarium subglutinans]|uniref:F-box domain protein n=1 Tax=Gibberella subglutinans TaxID=42677 RepID=A0A8H5QDA3_GIBSU|nr:f-box domain protein [Fusarium subglutinans]KAF5611811.1 f-box domain protein [Fusarium subglutinans]
MDKAHYGVSDQFFRTRRRHQVFLYLRLWYSNLDYNDYLQKAFATNALSIFKSGRKDILPSSVINKTSSIINKTLDDISSTPACELSSLHVTKLPIHSSITRGSKKPLHVQHGHCYKGSPFTTRDLGNVISFLPQSDIKNLRFVDHRFSSLASRQLFQRTRLLARAKDNNDPQRFIQLAKSELSGFIREVRCDVSSIVYNGFYYMEKDQFEFLPVFWDALPLLARFRNIQTLHLCFDASFTLRDFKEGSNQFRSRVLKSVFRILMGTFTKEVSTPIDTLSGATIEIPHQGTPSSPITLSTLIISNLGDFHDPELTNMPEFNTAMGNIKALRLDVAQHKERWGGGRFSETTEIPNQCREMFTQLPLTWLSSTVTANLQVLSLHYQSYWGWFPNIDIRLIGSGNGMPKLRSLALGRFVFSHQLEVDWITSLDLEELSLEDCAVLARHVGHPTTQEGFWTDGHELPATTKIGGQVERIYLWWHEIIWQIRSSMLNLKRFVTSYQPDLHDHFLRFCEVNPFLGSGHSLDDKADHTRGLWREFKDLSKNNCLPWNTAFQHFTCVTSPKLCLESDVFLLSHSDRSTSFITRSSDQKYISHDPTYMEQASYHRDLYDVEVDPEIGNMNKLAKIEIVILHSMLSKRRKKEHMGAEELRLSPKMGLHDTNEYVEGVLHPLLTYEELILLGLILRLSDGD